MKLMVIDGNSILNRAYYGIRPLSTKDGLYTHAVYGFLTTMQRLLDEENPDALCVAFDVHAPTFRHTAEETYKATRKPMPAELAEQVPVLKEVLDDLNIPRYELAGWEADDLIGTISRRCEADGWDCVVVTGVTLATGEYANIGYDRAHNAYWKASGDYVPAAYPGTGDIFASVLTGSFLMGDSLPMAMDRATRYVELTIKTTYGYSTDPREGVMLERTLEWLTQREVPKNYRAL